MDILVFVSIFSKEHTVCRSCDYFSCFFKLEYMQLCYDK